MYAYIYIYVYIYVYEQETSVCMCCTVTNRKHKVCSNFHILLILSHVCLWVYVMSVNMNIYIRYTPMITS